MNITIRLSRLSDLPAYTMLLQETYEATYTNDKMGISKSLFSMKIFSTKSTQTYLLSNLRMTKQQRTWLAFDGSQLVGSITIRKKIREAELRGFYVKPTYQKQGIGTRLWNKALFFAHAYDIVLDTYIHNTKTITLYKQWGFDLDYTKGSLMRHWDEWPENIRIESIYMRRPAEQI